MFLNLLQIFAFVNKYCTLYLLRFPAFLDMMASKVNKYDKYTVQYPNYTIQNSMHTTPNIQISSWITKKITYHKKITKISWGPIVRGPVVWGPTVRLQKVANWAPDSWAPGPSCPGPNCPPWKSGKLGPGQLGPGNILFQNHQKTNTASKIQTEMLPNVNFVPFRPNVVLKRQDTSFQLAKNHCKSHNCHPKYQYHHPNHQIPTT